MLPPHVPLSGTHEEYDVETREQVPNVRFGNQLTRFGMGAVTRLSELYAPGERASKARQMSGHLAQVLATGQGKIWLCILCACCSAGTRVLPQT